LCVSLEVASVCPFASSGAAEQVLEGTAELDRHRVVEDGVNGAVHVHHDSAEQLEPVVVEAEAGKGVVDDPEAVGHPEHRKQADHHRQHLDHLGAHRG